MQSEIIIKTTYVRYSSSFFILFSNTNNTRMDTMFNNEEQDGMGVKDRTQVYCPKGRARLFSNLSSYNTTHKL